MFYFLFLLSPKLEKKGALYSDGLHHAAPSRKQLVGGKWRATYVRGVTHKKKNISTPLSTYFFKAEKKVNVGEKNVSIFLVHKKKVEKNLTDSRGAGVW